MKRPEPSKQHKIICRNQNNVKRTNEKRNKPDADLENVAYELSSNGRNTNLTTKLSGNENLTFTTSSKL